MNTLYPPVKIKASKEIPLLAGHPWVFSHGVDGAPDLPTGSLVEVYSSRGVFVGIGTYHPANTIRIRLLTDKRERIDDNFFRERFVTLLNEKTRIIPPDTEGFRLVHADADQLPGLVVDLYRDTAVFQIHTAGMERLREVILNALRVLPSVHTIVERSDVEARRMEHLPLLEPSVHWGTAKEPVQFLEEGMVMLCDVLKGQKTGYFLDQRPARSLVRKTAKGRTVVNLFSYTCAFGVSALLGGALEVTNVDVSSAALTLGRQIAEKNGIKPEDGRIRYHPQDVFEYLEAYSPKAQQPLLLICDPPAFAKSRTSLEAAKKAYLRLNTLCFQILQAGDIFLTSSCSGMLSQEEFLHILRIAAGRAGKQVKILGILGQAVDHTRTLAFTEGVYLKTVFMEIRS